VDYIAVLGTDILADNHSPITMVIRCIVTPLSLLSPEGLEAVELYVCRDFDSFVQKPEPEQREPVSVLTATGMYRGGLRTLQQAQSVYLCPDLISEWDGSKVSLARILKENGIKPKDEVNVRIEGGRWAIGVS
jgi:hypothetical protein